MSTTPGIRHRPGGITLIVVLAVINALGSIVGGIWVLLDRNNHQLLQDSGLTQHGLAGSGIAAIVIGTIGLFIAMALARGTASLASSSASGR
jgi:hypothetical protein